MTPHPRRPTADTSPAARPDDPLSATARLADPRQNAAVYVRKSVATGQGVKDQIDTCVRYAVAVGHRVPEQGPFRFADDAVSGATTSRPGLNALLELARSGRAPFDRICIREVDRLTRADDARFVLWFEYELKRCGITVTYVKENLRPGDEDDPITYLKRLMEAIGASSEKQKINRRTREGRRRRFAEGYFVGNVAPYGTERVLVPRGGDEVVQVLPRRWRFALPDHRIRLRWVPALLPTVRRILFCLERGDSARAVARMLAATGAPTPDEGQVWTERMVKYIARDPIYVGDYLFGRRRVLRGETARECAPSLIESNEPMLRRDFLSDPPISREQFTNVQRRLDDARDVHLRRMASRGDYPLTGLLACAECGARLHGHAAPATSGKGTERRYYRHPGGRTKSRGGAVTAIGTSGPSLWMRALANWCTPSCATVACSEQPRKRYRGSSARSTPATMRRSSAPRRERWRASLPLRSAQR